MTPVQELFISFIKERENARIAKEHGVFPHTDDPVIRKFSFCNVNREHDRVTRWIKDNMRESTWALASPDNMVTAMSLGRVFNHPPVLAQLYPFKSFPWLRKECIRIKSEGKIFRGAYKMPAHGSSGAGGSSADYFLNAIEAVSKMDFSEVTHLEDVATMIQKAKGFGPFLSNQIITDLRYTPFWKDAPDWQTFVLCGPGTKRGLCRFFGVELKTRPNSKRQKSAPLSQNNAVRMLRDAQTILTPVLEKRFIDIFRDPNNFSNCFCEFSKYARTLEGGNPPKTQYRNK